MSPRRQRYWSSVRGLPCGQCLDEWQLLSATSTILPSLLHPGGYPAVVRPVPTLGSREA
jgi:hypothetical protein